MTGTLFWTINPEPHFQHAHKFMTTPTGQLLLQSFRMRTPCHVISAVQCRDCGAQGQAETNNPPNNLTHPIRPSPPHPPGPDESPSARSPPRTHRSTGSNMDSTVGLAGFEPTISCSQSRRATKLRHSPLKTGRTVAGETGTACSFTERVTGIEPAQSAWKAEALPLSYTRMRGPTTRPATGFQYSRSPVL